MNYSMLIRWSDEDQAYVVSFPDWEAVGHTEHVHGNTHGEAAQQGAELLENLIERARQSGEPMPPPNLFSETLAQPTQAM